MNENESPEVLFHESNFAVVRMPGRAYPGILIQGDSLMGLLGELGESIQLFDSNREESLECLKTAYDQLNWRFLEYMKVCKANGIS
jgi:hypothetical protein